MLRQGWPVYDSKAGQSRWQRNTTHVLWVHKTLAPGEIKYAGSRADESRNQADVSTVSTTNETVTGDNIGGADMILDAGDMAYGLVGPYNLKN